MTISADNPDKSNTAATGIRLVEINREPVELYKILKFEGMVSSGAEGKMVVAAGHVTVNGQIEVQKRKKIVTGDLIEFNGESIRITLAASNPETRDD